MAFTIEIHLGAEGPIIFDGWRDDAFGKYVLKGTPFADARGNSGRGFVVTNGPMVLKSKAEVKPGSTINPGDCIAYGCADGDEIPYGRPEMCICC